MILTETQTDALRELLNIGFARTGAALSQLTEHRVILGVPEVTVQPIQRLFDYLGDSLTGEVATVHQLFSGPMTGDAMLLLKSEDAARLIGMLTDQPLPDTTLDASAREVLTEVGNILLNACLGMLGNLLQVHLSFSVPKLQLDSLNSLLCTMVIDRQELSYALVSFTRFHLRDSEVAGVLVIVLGVTSLEHLILAIDAWATRSVEAPRAGHAPAETRADAAARSEPPG